MFTLFQIPKPPAAGKSVTNCHIPVTYIWNPATSESRR